jgi:hypothetical protein
MKEGELSPRDMRGKHGNRPNKVPDQTRTDIRDHIKSFPTYESHYTRNQSDNSKCYLNPELTVSAMYDMYIQFQRNNGGAEAEEWLYRDIFSREFDLKIGDPKLDSCDTCDKYKAQLSSANIPNRNTLEDEWNLHKDTSKAS